MSKPVKVAAMGFAAMALAGCVQTRQIADLQFTPPRGDYKLLVMRPDWGLILVAFWTVISLIFHAVRLAQASEQAARGEPIRSWLEG